MIVPSRTSFAGGATGGGAVTVVRAMPVAALVSVMPHVLPDPFLSDLRLSYAVLEG